MAQVFSKTSSMAIKIKGLEALSTLCGGQADGMNGVPSTSQPSNAVLDKYTIQEKVVPLLKGIKTKEPAVMVCSTSIQPDPTDAYRRWQHWTCSNRSEK